MLMYDVLRATFSNNMLGKAGPAPPASRFWIQNPPSVQLILGNAGLPAKLKVLK